MNFLKTAAHIWNNIVTVKSHGFTSIRQVGGSFGFNRFNKRKLIEDSYLKNDAVFSIIKKGASKAANTIIWRVMLVDTNGDHEEVFDTELNELLNKPNSYQTQSDWREQALTYLMASGESFMGGIEPVGFPTFSSLHNLPSDLTSFEMGKLLTDPILKFHVDWNFQREWLPENVLFTKYVSIDSNHLFGGLSPLEPGNRLLQSSNNLVTADAAMLKNRGASGLLTTRGNLNGMPKEMKLLDESLVNRLGGPEKFNKIISTAANVDFIPLGLSPKDLEILKSDVSKQRRFSNLWGFDSAQFNDPANKTYNNHKESNKAAYQDVYIPNDFKLVQGLNMWLAPKFPQPGNKKLVIVQDVSHIEVLQEDKKLANEIKTKNNTETLRIVNQFNFKEITRDGAILLLVKLGHTKDEASIIIQSKPKDDAEGQQ